MGAGASSEARGTIRSPFPVSPQTSRDLNKLSYVVNRILSTSDIYDIQNLAKPGVCGDYAVFLKQQIATQLLMFNAESADGSKVIPVAYQNPAKAFAKSEERQRICQQIASTMLTVVATVIACLGSIQVSTRPIALQQQGGGTETVRSWLGTNAYIVEADRGQPQGTPMQFQAPPQMSGRVTLTLLRSDPPISSGLLTISANTTASVSLRIHFLDPVWLIDGTRQVLPLRIVDESGLPWVVGMLVGNGSFKSFAETTATPFLDLLFALQKSSTARYGGGDLYIEKRDQIAYAAQVFEYIRRNPGEASRTVSRIFGKMAAVAAPVVAAAIPPAVAPGVVVPYGAPVPVAPVQPPAVPGFPSFAPTATLRPVARPLPGFAPQPPPALARFDVPSSATAEIQRYVKRAQGALGVESNPAAVRAYLLAGDEREDRMVTTAVCNDPYWRATNLGSVYPWLTLQLLSVKDITRMGDKAAVKFHDEWSDFLGELQKVYATADIGISLQLPSAGPSFLESIRVAGLADSSICRNPVASYKPVQDGLLRLQGLYEEHVADIWDILNNLILLVVDPVTKTEIVKLHPKVVEEGTASRKYVERVAARAREAIAAYYLDVEKTYVATIRAIVSGRAEG